MGTGAEDLGQFTDQQVYAAWMQLRAAGGALIDISKEDLQDEVNYRMRRFYDQTGAVSVEVRDESGAKLGKITLSQPGEPQPRVDNEQRLLAWVKENNPGMVREVIDPIYLKQLTDPGQGVVAVADDETVVHLRTGEKIPGLVARASEGGRVSPRYNGGKDQLGRGLIEGSFGAALPVHNVITADPPQRHAIEAPTDVVDAEIVDEVA